MPTVYLNLSPQNHAYIQAAATRGRTTQTNVIDAIISEARQLGWQIEHVERAKVVQPPPPAPGAASGVPPRTPPHTGRDTAITGTS